MKKIFFLILLILVFPFAKAQYTLVEKFEPKDITENNQPNPVKIPFSKYLFTNGLTLIVSEDHNNPLVNINITYKIGSANDYADRTGMAYMIFKLMDKGSKHLASGEYQRTISQYGGKVFSEITRDRTSFSVTVTKNVLPLVLWMESDRQAYFLDSLTTDKFDNAKLEIMAMIYDSLYHQKYGLPDVLAQKNLYQFGHPYTWPEFGMLDHYQAFSITDLKKFYLDWYGSNNTIITITGDVKTEDVITLVNNYFGLLTPAPQTTSMQDELFNRIAASNGTEFTEPRYISYKIDVPYPMLKIVFNTVPKNNTDEKALDVMACILGQGENSVLYNELVKAGYAESVIARHTTYQYAGEFSIDIKAKPDTSLQVILSRVNKVLNDLASKRNLASYVRDIENSYSPGFPVQAPMQNNMPQALPPQPGDNPVVKGPPGNKPLELQRNREKSPQNYDPATNQIKSGEIIYSVVSALRTNDILNLESLENRGMVLAETEKFNSQPSNISNALSNYSKISTEHFYSVLNRYILTSAKLYLSIVPKNKEFLILAKDNIVERELKSILTPTQEKDLVFRYPIKEINKKKPAVSELYYNPGITLRKDSSINGMKIFLTADKHYSMVSFGIRLDVSKVMKLYPGMDMASFISDKYNEWFKGQGTFNQLKMSELTGAKVKFSPAGCFVDMNVLCVPEQAMLVKEAILNFLSRPEFNMIALFPVFIQNIEDSATVEKYAFRDLSQAIKTLSDPMQSANPPEGSIDKTKSNIEKVKKVSASFTDINNPIHMSSYTVGNIEEGMYFDYYMRLSGWMPPKFYYNNLQDGILNPDSIKVNKLSIPTEGNVFFIENSHTDFATIVIEYMQVPVAVSPDFYTARLANYYFGNSISNYLKQTLSKKEYILKFKTLNYFRNNLECFALAVTVTPEKFQDANNEILSELNRFKNAKISKKELKLIKKEYMGNKAVATETLLQKQQFVNNLISFNIPVEVMNNENDYLKKIKPSKIPKFWKKYYFESNNRTVVIGNEAKLQTAISNTGNKIIKIDKSGTILN